MAKIYNKKFLEHLGEKALKPLTTEQIQLHFHFIVEDVFSNNKSKVCTVIDFLSENQRLPNASHSIVEAVILIKPKHADPSWFHHNKDNILDAEAVIGEVEDHITYVPKTLAIWEYMPDNEKQYRYDVLDSVYVAVIANDTFDKHGGVIYDAAEDYVMLTWFISGEMFTLKLPAATDVEAVKAFIADVTATLKANPEKKSKDMPKEEAFQQLISLLTPENISEPIPSSSKDNDAPKRRVFDEQFKITIVKRIKEDKLPVAQVAKELGVRENVLYKWIQKYGRLIDTDTATEPVITTDTVTQDSE